MPTLANLFEQYDELAEDVARSKHGFFQGNLQRWISFLKGTAPFARPILQQLEAAVDFKSWFEPYRSVGMGHGTRDIEWPEDRNKRLGIQLLLFQQFANGSVHAPTFALTVMRSGKHANDGISDIINQLFLPMMRELRRFLLEVTQPPAIQSATPSPTGAVQIADEVKKYEQELADILARFSHAHDGIHISAEDDPILRQYVRELIDLLNDALGKNSYSRQIAAEFNEGISNFYHSPSYKSVENILGIVRAVLTRLARNPELLNRTNGSAAVISRKVFIVHGHAGIEQSIARFLTHLALEPIILHEQPNQGRTIIEKFEDHSDVGFAVVLLTADDVGGARNGQQHPRARQNVILELGYFIGRLGRGRVCALQQGGVELPSDILGVLWEALDEHGAWKLKLAKELQAAKYEFDWSKVGQ